ncbi:RagB/SusD family nutrient uptake outer membrane protein [Niabella beijingensis]|uniref:RagB/SusD family nutrient uptake outer membrane protein n=1 Tax=Niabella beijingensis TaxID=2872700 RepID=UPI001CBF2A6F|nr:RagB/SusD family nutrient uptake outer membrane protein [Niabella beijingensis]MBZ4190884.1 RagB/SusD family nutrient uptake outer membrane protein [Niabella beijingensis]
MKKIIIVVLVILQFFMTGCKKFLDTRSNDFLTPNMDYSSVQLARQALNGCMLNLRSQWMFSGWWQARGIANTEDGVTTIVNVVYSPATLLSDATDVNLASRWTNCYQAIQRCNFLLDQMQKSSLDSASKAPIIGVALFLRGFYYFILADEWGAVPLRLAPTAGPADKALARSPVAAVYAQILKDMETAEKMVPAADVPGYGGAGYPSRSTVQGMLARVCLTMAGAPLHDASKYQEANKWAQKVMNSGLHELNPSFQQVFINYIADKYDPKESLWELDNNVATAGTPLGCHLGYLDGPVSNVPDTGVMVGQVFPTRILYNMYQAKDQRRDWVICPYSYGNNSGNGARTNWSATQIYERNMGLYRLNYSLPPHITQSTPVNWPFLRYSDVLLMIAEAENAVSGGPTPLAYSCINQVRRRAWGKLQAGAGDPEEADLAANLDQAAFLQAVQNERLMELAYQGLRRHDLIRWGLYEQTLQKMKNDVNDASQPAVNATRKNFITTIVNNYQPRDTLWPVPVIELQQNSLCTQNPGF